MKSDIKSEWVSALRSGFYKQGKYQLRESETLFDATGVLCELAVNAGIIEPATFTPKPKDNPERSWSGYKYGTGATSGTGLPQAVCEWAGIEYRTAYRVAMKGDRGMSFKKLADWIEENL